MYNTKEGKTCVIYIRVSSERQVKGYNQQFPNQSPNEE